jgi:phosphoribosylformylglycinamidine synthase
VTIGVVQFPGTNCERDVVEVVRDLGATADIVWHADRALPSTVDAVVLPGGFAHGDYLRTGAIARFSPIMKAVGAFALDGGAVVGICNGFQILCEAGLLPGALQKNAGLKFVCAPVDVRVETDASVLTSDIAPGTTLRLPVNHFEGCYTCSPVTLRELRVEDRIVVRYVTNPNGSVDDIAGICSPRGNVVGLMPHPERACHALLGSTDGRPLMQALVSGQDARLMPARLSTAGGTPTSRQAP